jgi:dimethylamine corrinoid protein
MFDRGEIFLPEVMVAADAMKAAVEALKPALSELVKAELKRGRFLIGTVEGDVHDIGKGIVATMLEAAGFEVIDLGRDVPMSVFLEKTKELKPDIVGLSALMTVTRENQKVFIEMLKKEGIRDKFIVMVGGGATTGEWAERIRADGWGEDAPSAVKKAIELIEKKKKGGD